MPIRQIVSVLGNTGRSNSFSSSKLTGNSVLCLLATQAHYKLPRILYKRNITLLICRSSRSSRRCSSCLSKDLGYLDHVDSSIGW